MKKEVYKHLLRTYGNLPLLWIGMVFEFIRVFVHRVVVVILIAKITSLIASGDIDTAKRTIFLLVIFYTAASLIGLTGELMAIHTTDARYKLLLMDFYKKLIGKDMSFYRDHQTGYLSSLFRQHLDGTMALVRLFRTDILQISISLIFPAVVLLHANVKIGFVAICIVVLQIAYVSWSSQLADKYRKSSQEIYRKLTGEVADDVTNTVAFKSSGNEMYTHEKVATLASEEGRLFWARHKMSALLDVPRFLLTICGVGIGFYITLSHASGSPESAGLIVLTFMYLFQIMRNVGDLPDLAHRHDEHVARVYPTLQYLTDYQETVRDPEHPKPLKISQGAVEIKDVDFAYALVGNTQEKYPVFKKLNIHIKGGEHIGVVGLSGAGKSTLAGLLMRFDDTDAGSITIDGINIRDVRQTELRQKIAYVPQEPLLFHRSIKENIAYFKKEATQEEIVNAAKAAHAHDFITQLSGGYDALVGERGIKLSGGQKQRIVIARAILKNAPIMIFDEATSALDSESEQIIQQALPAIIGKHTAIVIAHRLSTIARLDRILVMHDGAIIEEGTHDELLAQQGRYYSLWQKQAGKYEERIKI